MKSKSNLTSIKRYLVTLLNSFKEAFLLLLSSQQANEENLNFLLPSASTNYTSKFFL